MGAIVGPGLDGNYIEETLFLRLNRYLCTSVPPCRPSRNADELLKRRRTRALLTGCMEDHDHCVSRIRTVVEISSIRRSKSANGGKDEVDSLGPVHEDFK